MDVVVVVLVLFSAAFTQSLSGFGAALVSMALLPALVGIKTASPLVAVFTLTLEVILLVRYREGLNFRAIWPVILGSVPGVPLGLLILNRVDEQIVLVGLGALITGYALYGLLEMRLPTLESPVWAYAFGFVAGMLGGAYNTSGPPVVIYANCRGWDLASFKSNLQSFFLVSSLLVVGAHALNHNLTPDVWRYYGLSLPAMGLGALAGTSLDRWLPPKTFQQIVLVLLIFMGGRLMLG